MFAISMISLIAVGIFGWGVNYSKNRKIRRRKYKYNIQKATDRLLNQIAETEV